MPRCGYNEWHIRGLAYEILRLSISFNAPDDAPDSGAAVDGWIVRVLRRTSYGCRAFFGFGLITTAKLASGGRAASAEFRGE